MTSAGRILILPKGNYNADAPYEMLDLVSHNGKSWLAKKTVVGIEPTEENSEYWQDMFKLNIVNNLDATEEGGVLDARMGNYIKDQLAIRHVTATATETLTFENGFVEYTTDLSEFGDGPFNVLVTALGVNHSFTSVITNLDPKNCCIQIFDLTDPNSTSEVVFRITFFFGK